MCLKCCSFLMHLELKESVAAYGALLNGVAIVTARSFRAKVNLSKSLSLLLNVPSMVMCQPRKLFLHGSRDAEGYILLQWLSQWIGYLFLIIVDVCIGCSTHCIDLLIFAQFCKYTCKILQGLYAAVSTNMRL